MSTNDKLGNPMAEPNFFDLRNNESLRDDVELTPGLLAGYDGGLRALNGDDTVKGSSDGEIVNGNAGKDVLFGGEGADFFQGGRDNDRVYGDSGDDTLNGNIGEDLVDGGDGNDLVRGGQDDDLLVGGQGNDTVIGDLGQDALIGGADSDVFVLRTDTPAATAKEADILIDFDKVSDRIGLTGSVFESNLSFEAFSWSIKDDLRVGLKSLGIPESQLDSLTPQVLNYLQSFSGATSQQTNLGQFLLDRGLGNSQEILTIVTSYVSYQQLDPNGDGLLEGTAIKLNDKFFGVVLNATAADLSGRFTEF